jgi:adenosylcobinamide-GDP ribazoletransferase
VGEGRVVPGLVLAIRFLTVVPVPGREAADPGALGRAALWFPPVGLVLGLVLAVADRGLSRLFPPLVAALLVVSLWKALTGGLHLDGLADCLDGLAGRDPAHRLAIMRDSQIGVFGALGIVLAVLLACAVLAELPTAARWPTLLLAPTVGRLAPLVAGVTARPATPAVGSGAAFMGALPGWAALVHTAAVLALGALVLGPFGLAVVLAGLGAAVLATWALARGLGGATGDVLGAGVELAELGVLLAASASARLSGL